MTKISIALIAGILLLPLTGQLASAQQATPDDQIQFLSKAVATLQLQRNAAQDAAAQATAQGEVLQAKLASVQKELDTLKTKDAPKAPAVNVVEPPKEAPAK